MRHFMRVKQRDPILPHLSSSGGKRGESPGVLQACSAGPQRHRALWTAQNLPNTEACVSFMAVLWDLINLCHLLSNLPEWPSSKQHLAPLPYPWSAYLLSSREGSLILGRCFGDQCFWQSPLLPLYPQATLETQPILSALGEAKRKWGKPQLSYPVYWVLATPLKVTTPPSPASTVKAIIVLGSGNRQGLLSF